MESSSPASNSFTVHKGWGELLRKAAEGGQLSFSIPGAEEADNQDTLDLRVLRAVFERLYDAAGDPPVCHQTCQICSSAVFRMLFDVPVDCTRCGNPAKKRL